ncbi:T9SS type A sorting domain-containing protein [Flammeovirga sp. MY04]|uniref:T9SS type A sorting domain-containing protein n=1 Tax=Flammeovirga sp. MY04 TaxID=1191459 RepID=UPI0008060ABE|nr:T9SS type A sorting domain-containing protein [Flammeovirga sp. MY04]ANQ52658.1 T9SS type A sorting domain-containing protein [Flammeovirga sp. MY04]
MKIFTNATLITLFIGLVSACTSSVEEEIGSFTVTGDKLPDEIRIFEDTIIVKELSEVNYRVTNGASIIIKPENDNMTVNIKKSRFFFENGSQFKINNSVHFTNTTIELEDNYQDFVCIESTSARIKYENNNKEYPKGCYNKIDLPVEMIYINSEKRDNNILIKWATATEENSDYFGVERSFDKKQWKEISQVKSAGNSQVKIDYSFLDDKIGEVNQVVYHRLKQVDLDGNYSYYGPVAVKMGDQNTGEVTMYPNPVKYQEDLNIVTNYETMNVKVFDMSGRVYHEKTYQKNFANIPMNFGVGMLMVEVTSGSQKVTEKIMVQ